MTTHREQDERGPDAAREDDRQIAHEEREEQVGRADNNPNPPRTTRKNVTAPKFGSAGSGSAELEPGPERD